MLTCLVQTHISTRNSSLNTKLLTFVGILNNTCCSSTIITLLCYVITLFTSLLMDTVKIVLGLLNFTQLVKVWFLRLITYYTAVHIYHQQQLRHLQKWHKQSIIVPKNKTKSCMIDNIFIPLNQFRVQKMEFACALPERNSQNFPRQYPMQQLGWSRVQNQVHNQAQILDLSLDKHVWCYYQTSTVLCKTRVENSLTKLAEPTQPEGFNNLIILCFRKHYDFIFQLRYTDSFRRLQFFVGANINMKYLPFSNSSLTFSVTWFTIIPLPALSICFSKCLLCEVLRIAQLQ